MNRVQSGVLLEQDVSFHTPGELAQQLYLYLLCCGRYVCDGAYRVDRQRYDSYLLLFVLRGQGYWGDMSLKAGDLALIDCYQPHTYGTNDGWEILWCHFDGGMAAAYAEKLKHMNRLRIPHCGSDTAQAMTEILQHPADETCVHLALTRLLTGMLVEREQQRATVDHLGEVKAYISQHFAEPITLEQLSAMACLSPFHFTRVFQRETGTTPHAYLLRVRINAACYYLRSQDTTIREVAWQCGFASESAFCKVFRRMLGLSPRAYRLSANEPSPAMMTKE